MANPWNPFEHAIASSNAIKKASEAVGPVKKPLEAANDIYADISNPGKEQQTTENKEQVNNVNRSLSKSALKSLSKNVNPTDEEMLESIASMKDQEKPGWMAIPEIPDVTEDANNAINSVFGNKDIGTENIYRPDGIISADELLNGPIQQGTDTSKAQMNSLISAPTKDKQYAQDIYEDLFGEDIIRNDVPDTYFADPYAISSEIINDKSFMPRTGDDKKQDILRHYGHDENTTEPVDVGLSNIDNEYQADIDDGNMREGNLKSIYMTGKRYKEYINAGIGGRDIDDIDDNGIYNKIEEQQYGFVPYSNNGLVDSALYTGQNILGRIGDFFNKDVANIRSNLFQPTYTINEKSFNGNDFHDAANDYFKRVNEKRDEAGIYTVTLDDGSTVSINDTDYYFIDEEGNPIETDENGSPVLTAEDPVIIRFPNSGQEIEFNDVDDYLTNFNVSDYTPEDLVLPDGTTLTHAEAVELANGGGERDYGPFNIAKPASETGDFLEDGGFNFEDFLPNTIDMMAMSAPYFFPQTSVPLAASNFAKSVQGIDPTSVEKDNTYSMMSDDMSQEKIIGSSLGYAATPATEIGLGRIGSDGILKAFTKWLPEKFGERAWMPTANWLIGTAGEGLEEIPGNLMEDLSQNGFRGWFANPIYQTDEDGNIILDENGEPKPLYDSTGHPVRDYDTSLGDRFVNFWEEAPEAFVGGGILGGLFGIPEIKSTVQKTNEIRKDNKEAIDSGVGIYIPTSTKNLYKPMTREELYGE